MTRVLATLALVFAQALPWVGGPLFVCIERDGNVCLDRGPQNCNCCVAETDGSACCHDEHAAIDAAGNSAHHAVFNAEPCDCEHELWEAAPTTPAGRTPVALADHAAYAAYAVSVEIAPIIASQGAALDAFGGPSAGAAERILACVVLRC